MMQLEQDIPASVQVRVYLLGPLEIWKRDPTGTWRLVEKETWKKSRPARFVFKRLLVQPGRRLSRSCIEDDLWSETDNFELATKNVYNAISLIRGVIGNSLVKCWEATYELAGQALIWTDIEACAALLKEAENRGQTSIQALPFLEQALTMFERGEFLDHVEIDFESSHHRLEWSCQGYNLLAEKPGRLQEHRVLRGLRFSQGEYH